MAQGLTGVTADTHDSSAGDSDVRVSSSGLVRALWIMAGTISLAIGLVGVVVPVLPTTPFLLIAAACYLRGSRRMYDWMVSTRFVGRYLSDYVEGRGVSVRAKVVSIIVLWVLIILSAALATGNDVARLVLAAVGIAVTAHLVMLRTKR
jgi:uncharacterized protein